ncbi:MAG: hypothetical protein R3C52_15420 [Hyphomonadaceae bacterium]
MRMLMGGLAALAICVGGCGENDAAERQQALRSPERVQQKTAEALSVADIASVAVSNIHLEEHPRGKSLIVVWDAKTPDGDYRCNSDKRVDFPVCEPAG